MLHRPHVPSSLAFACLATALTVACSGETSAPAGPLVDVSDPPIIPRAAGTEPPKVLIIGLDGADLRKIDELVGQKRLPHIAALMQRGVTSLLETVASASPIVWTTVATGVVPEKHGITDFRKDGIPANTTFRTRPALWNILSHYDRTVGILSWWATFPAEHVNGYLVSPFIVLMPPLGTKSNVGNLWEAGDPRKCYPPDLQHRVADLIYTEETVDLSKVGHLYADRKRTTNTPWVLAKDRSYYDIALRQMREEPVETVAVYFQGIDASSHDFDRHVHGRNMNLKRKPIVSAEEFDAAMERVLQMYEYNDRLVGGLVAQAGPDTDIIVLSDHGWNYDGTSHWNNDPGVFIAAGPSFLPGRGVEGLSVLDVAPIVLAILGVPLSRQFDGKLPAGVLREDLVAAVEWIEDYPIPPVALPEGTTADSPANAAMNEQLRNLGYIGGGSK